MSAPCVLVTRPNEQAAPWVSALREAGLAAAALPLLAIEALADPAPLRALWHRLEEVAFVMFVSANAVERFFATRPSAVPWPAGTRAGATGPGTRSALLAAGVGDTSIDWPGDGAARYDAESLWQLIEAQSWRGRSVVVLRGEDGRDWLAERFRERGAAVEFVAAYRRFAPQWGAAEESLAERALADPAAHLWLFSSSEALGHLQTLCAGGDWSAARALATHPRIAAAALRLGFAQVQTVAPTLLAVIDAARAAGMPKPPL